MKIKKETKLVAAGLLLIMLTAFAARAYKFEPWLYFKMDQARDAMLIENALQKGPGYLPLLGPRAGATEVSSGFLRLGPAYYYMQYLAGVLSGGNLPMSNAYPDLFFSIAVLPLLYVFLRLYFSRFNSLLVTAMYAFSFLIIEYSRFAWNPNTLPFFFILAFYGLLRFFSEENFKKALGWIGLWAFGAAIGAQLHFFGFFSLIGISGLMFLWHWKIWEKEFWQNAFSKTKLKSLAAFGGIALGVFLLVSAPIIISDVYRKGENSKNFIQALGTKAEKKPFLDKLEKNVTESIGYYCLLSTSGCATGEWTDSKNVWPASFSLFLLLTGILIVIGRLFGEKEVHALRRDFLFFMLAWLGVFFILSVPVAFQLRPRFYIVVFALPFILFGFIFKALQEKLGRKGLLLSLFFALGVIALNAKGTSEWFREQSLSELGNAKIERSLILKAKDGIMLGQLQGAADFMYDRHKPGAKIYYYVKPEHVAPIKFLLDQKNDPFLRYANMGKQIEEGAQIFAIIPTGTDPEGEENDFITKFGYKYQVLAQKKLGQITIFEAKVENIKTVAPVISDSVQEENEKDDRVFWKDVFGSNKPKKVLQK